MLGEVRPSSPFKYGFRRKASVHVLLNSDDMPPKQIAIVEIDCCGAPAFQINAVQRQSRFELLGGQRWGVFHMMPALIMNPQQILSSFSSKGRLLRHHAQTCFASFGCDSFIILTIRGAYHDLDPMTAGKYHLT